MTNRQGRRDQPEAGRHWRYTLRWAGVRLLLPARGEPEGTAPPERRGGPWHTSFPLGATAESRRALLSTFGAVADPANGMNRERTEAALAS
jgi:hypothetical protein